MEIGLKIKELRMKKKLTPLQLSQKMGVTRDLVYQYESNKTIPPIEKLEILSKCLDVDVSYFVSDKNEKQNKSETFTNANIEEKLTQLKFYIMGKFGIKKEQWDETLDELFSAKFRQAF